MTTPAAATHMIVLPTTTSGRAMRPIASQVMPPTTTSKIMAFVSAGENGKPAPTIRAAFSRQGLADLNRCPCDEQTENVAHVVAGIGKQRERMRGHTINNLDKLRSLD